MQIPNSYTNKTVSSLNTYAASVRDFFRSKTDKGLDTYYKLYDGLVASDISDIINPSWSDLTILKDTIDQYITSLSIPSTSMITIDGKYQSFNNYMHKIIIDQWNFEHGPDTIWIDWYVDDSGSGSWLEGESDFPTRHGSDRVEATLSYVNGLFESAIVSQRFFDLLASTGDTDALYGMGLSIFSSAKTTAGAQTTEIVMSLLKDRSISIPGKVSLLLSMLGVNDAVSTGDLYSSVNFSEYTGVNPATLWIADAWNSVPSLITSGVQTICAAIVGFASLITSGLSTIYNKVCHWFNNMVDGGVYYTKHLTLDPYVDTGALSFVGPTTDLGKEALHTYYGISVSDATKVNSFINSHGLLKIPTPFATIYVYPKAIWSTSDQSPTFRIFFHPISEEDYVLMSNEGNSTIEELFSSWASFNGFSNALVDDSDASSNSQFINSIAYSRLLFSKWCTAIVNSHNGVDTSISAFSGNISWIGNPHNPSNTNLTMLKTCYQLCDGNGNFVDFDSLGSLYQAYALANFNPDAEHKNVVNLPIVIKALYYYILDLYNDVYRPYVLCTNITQGSYSIISDQAAYANFNNAMKVLGVVVVAASVLAIGLHVKRNLQLKFQASESAYWAAINSKDAEGARKAARKSSWYASLLNVGGNTSNVLTGFKQSSTADMTVIEKLIAG